MKRPSSSKPQPERVFFADRDLGRILPEALVQAGLHVERHDSHFGPHTLDTEWLREVGRRGWIALTHNKAIRYNTEERDMVMRSGVPLFMLIGKHSHDILARNFVQTIPRVLSFLAEHQPPFIARIYKAASADYDGGKPGRVELWLDHRGWTEALRRR